MPGVIQNKMAGEEDVLSKALADLNLVSSSEFRLKQEQEVAVRALLDGKDVLAVLPTGSKRRSVVTYTHLNDSDEEYRCA